MTRTIALCLALLTLPLSAAPALACGGYGSFVDPNITAVRSAALEFGSARLSDPMVEVRLLALEGDRARAEVHASGPFAYRLRLARTEQGWRVRAWHRFRA